MALGGKQKGKHTFRDLFYKNRNQKYLTKPRDTDRHELKCLLGLQGHLSNMESVAKTEHSC